jgi:hypothetical protein
MGQLVCLDAAQCFAYRCTRHAQHDTQGSLLQQIIRGKLAITDHHQDFLIGIL